jgi:tetratricopeptide (TPR) repeat protein
MTRSDSLYARALDLDPRNARIRAQWALWRALRDAMSDDVALAALRRAVQDDPLNAWVGAMCSFGLTIVGRHEESVLEARRALDLDADSFFARFQVMRALAMVGSFYRALDMAPGLLMDSGRHVWALGLLAWIHARMGRVELARACYAEMEGRSGHEFVSRAWLSSSACSAGRYEEAVAWMDQAIEEGDPMIFWPRRMPFWDLIRNHPKLAAATAVSS